MPLDCLCTPPVREGTHCGSGGGGSGGGGSGGGGSGERGGREGWVACLSKTLMQQDFCILVVVMVCNLLSVEGVDVWQGGEDTENIRLQANW